MKHQESIEQIIAELLGSRNITKENVKKDLEKIENPFDRLKYIDEILTFIRLNLRSGVINIETNLYSILLEKQREAINSAREMAEMDNLTGLLNRGSIEGKMREPKEKYAVLMIDIDNFKKINDIYGHKAGDIVLKNFAKIVLENVRESFVGRYGGEEFYVELNQTNKEGGRIAAERLRKSVEENLIKYVVGDLEKEGNQGMINKLKSKKITISIGVADEQQGKTPYAVRENADKALYNAKKYGRNMVVVNGENPLDNFSYKKRLLFYIASSVEFLGRETIRVSENLRSLLQCVK